MNILFFGCNVGWLKVTQEPFWWGIVEELVFGFRVHRFLVYKSCIMWGFFVLPGFYWIFRFLIILSPWSLYRFNSLTLRNYSAQFVLPALIIFVYLKAPAKIAEYFSILPNSLSTFFWNSVYIFRIHLLIDFWGLARKTFSKFDDV